MPSGTLLRRHAAGTAVARAAGVFIAGVFIDSRGDKTGLVLSPRRLNKRQKQKNHFEKGVLNDLNSGKKEKKGPLRQNFVLSREF